MIDLTIQKSNKISVTQIFESKASVSACTDFMVLYGVSENLNRIP